MAENLELVEDEMEPITVLSLFDGMSCGMLALEEAGIPVKKYYASEIKKIGIKVSRANYPTIEQVGDVTKLHGKDFPHINLLIGGSPCQDLSAAHLKRTGLSGEKSRLFYEYIRLKKEISPDYFLLENVDMPSYDRGIISSELGCLGININSRLVSPQERERVYWTNIPGDIPVLWGQPHLSPPKDLGINLQSILTSGFTDRAKSRCLLESDSRPLSTPQKMAHRYFNTGFTTLIFEKPSLDWRDGIRYMNQIELERCQTVKEGYTKCLSRNEAASVLGDGWTIKVISHIFKGLKKA